MIKTLKCTLLTAAMLVTTLSPTQWTNAATFTIGDGDNLIESKEEMIDYLKGDKINRMEGNYTLTVDVDFGGASITPLRIHYDTFDGGGHTLSNFKIERDSSVKNDSSTYVGLFQMNRGTIKNLHLKDVVVTGHTNVGALVGANNATKDYTASVDNCSVENATITGNTDVGGLIGNSTSSAGVTKAMVTNSQVTGVLNINCSKTTTGAFMGYNSATVKNCSVNVINTSVNITGPMEVGGFTGESETGSRVYSCTTNANVKATNGEAGGFVGDNDGNIYSSSSTGFIDGTDHVGGFVGTCPGVVKNCTSSCVVTGSRSGKVYAGGFVGLLTHGGKIESCTSTGSVTMKGNAVGGFCGMSFGKNVSIKKCLVGSAISMVSVSGREDVGGFIGSNAGKSGKVTVSSSRSYANTAGVKSVGGFIGKSHSKNSYVSSCQCFGTVSGKANTGAFSGYNAGGARIYNCKKNKTDVLKKADKFCGKNRGKLKKCK